MNDEQLILYYYGDGLDRAWRRRIAKALKNDAGLARRYEELTRDLDALQEWAPVRAPEGLQERLRATIHREARLEQPDRREAESGWRFRSFLFGSAVTAALAIGLGIGLWYAGDPRPTREPAWPAGPVTAEWSQAAFQRGLQAHFRSSRTNLQGLPEGEADERSALIADLLEQNRAYARLAVQNGAPDLARVLRSFEPVLLRLAAEDLAPADADALRARLEFEINVMLTILARRSSDEGTSTKQETTI